MDKKAIEERFKAIGECSSIEEARSLIIDFQNEVLQDYDDHEKVLAERETFKNENESLRQANMKLFLQIGSTEDNKQEKPIKEESDPDNLTYDNLFNEEGGLK